MAIIRAIPEPIFKRLSIGLETMDYAYPLALPSAMSSPAFEIRLTAVRRPGHQPRRRGLDAHDDRGDDGLA